MLDLQAQLKRQIILDTSQILINHFKMLNFESKIMPQQHVIRGSFGAILGLIWKTRDKNRHMKMLILLSINVRNLEVLTILVKNK